MSPNFKELGEESSEQKSIRSMTIISKITAAWRVFFLLQLFSSCSFPSRENQNSFARGQEIYLTHCISCHQQNGNGISGSFPGLKKAEITKLHLRRAIQLIKEGSNSEMGMRPIALSDQEIADVLNFIHNSWGNTAAYIKRKQIKAN